MQNTDANDNITDTNKNLEPWPPQPISLEILPTLPEAGSNQELEGIDKNSRIIHSDPEESQAKAKSRSRFSSAIRKLSRSTRKKNKTVGLIKSPSPDASSPTSTEPILSSDADELPTDRQVITKKKKKSIFSLKKSKVAPQKDSLDSLPPQTAKVLEPLFQDTQNEVLVTTERLSPSSEGKRKVQITIKSKKIEKVASTGKSNDSHPSPKSEKDQPSSTTTTPTSTPPQVRQSATITTTTTKTTSTTAASAAVCDSEDKKKLKWKTKSSSKSSAAAPQAKKSEGEKIIITQSSKDTPPKDKAPAKPSRLAASQHPTTNASHSTNTSSSSSTSTSTPANTSKTSGAIRKTATTTRAAIKLVTAAKTKAKSPAREAKKAPTTKAGKGSTTTTATVTKSSSPITTAVAATETTVKEESDLMINPQRGYRYPRPTSTEPADKSHESLGARQPTPSPPPSLTLTASLPASTHSNKDLSASTATQPQTSEIQSGLQSVTSNASLATPAISHHHQQQQHKSSQDNLVHISPANQADDHISLAESVQPSRTSAEDLVTARKPPPLQDTFNTSFGQFAFDLGDRVRPPPLVPKQLGYEPSSQDPYSVEHHSDDDSDTDTEDDHNRRRIPYISAAPSLYDEFNSLELRRAHFRNQSGVSDLSLDSHKEDISSFDDLNQMPAFGDLTMDQEMEPTIMTSTNAEKREHLYKILVIGELGTGKTSFIKRYVHQFFSQNYRATIGVDFALKVLHWDPSTIVRLQLWDIAGQERFGNMTRVYYKEAVGAFIVFDVTRSGTFDCVSKWKEDLDSKVQLPDGSPIPCILLANKCDQDKQGVVTNAEKMDEYVKEHGFAGWFETSAKENINIDEAARALVNKILLNDKLISASDLADSEKFNLNNSGDQTMNEDKSKCAC